MRSLRYVSDTTSEHHVMCNLRYVLLLRNACSLRYVLLLRNARSLRYV